MRHPCIHSHFDQSPRENRWVETIDRCVVAAWLCRTAFAPFGAKILLAAGRPGDGPAEHDFNAGTKLLTTDLTVEALCGEMMKQALGEARRRPGPVLKKR